MTIAIVFISSIINIFCNNNIIAELGQERCIELLAGQTNVGFFINDGAKPDSVEISFDDAGGPNPFTASSGETVTCTGFQDNRCGGSSRWTEISFDIPDVSVAYWTDLN